MLASIKVRRSRSARMAFHAFPLVCQADTARVSPMFGPQLRAACVQTGASLMRGGANSEPLSVKVTSANWSCQLGGKGSQKLFRA